MTNKSAPRPAGEAQAASASAEKAVKPELKADPQDRPEPNAAAAREKPVSEAEKELLKALRSIG